MQYCHEGGFTVLGGLVDDWPSYLSRDGVHPSRFGGLHPVHPSGEKPHPAVLQGDPGTFFMDQLDSAGQASLPSPRRTSRPKPFKVLAFHFLAVSVSAARVARLGGTWDNLPSPIFHGTSVPSRGKAKQRGGGQKAAALHKQEWSCDLAADREGKILAATAAKFLKFASPLTAVVSQKQAHIDSGKSESASSPSMLLPVRRRCLVEPHPLGLPGRSPPADLVSPPPTNEQWRPFSLAPTETSRHGSWHELKDAIVKHSLAAYVLSLPHPF
ncbi:hypothetical protein HPB49_004177 [Dermacentor silvarum]|uniref:Uncharacterized protein n=1 Tax=Dermacentor silvarum TaxID=543639 RepID=A0ACB8DMW9_DERSI|nr:hypothetical protein HPB49_004177 [Dermacentor silvarum]